MYKEQLNLMSGKQIIKNIIENDIENKVEENNYVLKTILHKDVFK